MRLNGIIQRVVVKDAARHQDRGGYGFIRDEDGHDRFFHANDVRGARFEELREGQRVTFEPLAGCRGGNGLRADNVEVVA